jgi:hypothetical protein
MHLLSGCLQVRSIAIPEYCVDTQNRNKDEKFGLSICSKNKQGAEQVSTNIKLFLLFYLKFIFFLWTSQLVEEF